MRNFFVILLFFSAYVHACEYEISDYKSEDKEDVLNLLLQDPYLLFPGKEDVIRGKLSYEKYIETFKECCDESLKAQEYKKRLLKKGTQLIGFAMLGIKGFEPPYVELMLLAIDKDFRKLGLGKRLINDTIALCKKEWPQVLKLHVDVLEDNKNAQEFYKKQGFSWQETTFGIITLVHNLTL